MLNDSIVQFINSEFQPEVASECISLIEAVLRGECVRKIVLFAGKGSNGKTTLLQQLWSDVEGAKFLPYQCLLDNTYENSCLIQPNKVSIFIQEQNECLQANTIKEYCGSDRFLVSPDIIREPLQGPIFIETNHVDEWKKLLEQNPALSKRVLVAEFKSMF